MRNYRDSFKSKYVKAADLKGKRVPVTIEEVRSDDIGRGEIRLVCYFRNQSKGLILNRTNCATIAKIAGTEDLDRWPGTRVVLVSRLVDFRGEQVDAVRIEEPGNSKAPAKQPEPEWFEGPGDEPPDEGDPDAEFDGDANEDAQPQQRQRW